MELAALTRAFRPDDIAHDPVNAAGDHVPLRRETATVA